MTWLILEAVELDPGSSYEARLRVQMATPEDEVAEEERFEGLWSEWSQAVSFRSPWIRGGCCPAGVWAWPPSPVHPTLPPVHSPGSPPCSSHAVVDYSPLEM